MNPSLRLSVPSLSRGALTLMLAACSSTSNEVQTTNDAGGSVDTGGGGGGDGGPFNGSGMTCPTQTQVTMAVKLTLASTWPGTTAVQQCPSACGTSGSATGNVLIWLLSNYTVDAQNKLSGQVKTCGNQTPPITLTSNGSASVGAPSGTTAQVQVTIPPSVWNAPTMPSAAVTGVLGGWNVGSSLSVDPVVTLSGLKTTSQWANPATAWPMSVLSPPDAIAMSDISDDDGDGHPGITATPSSMSPFYVPHTSLDPSVSSPTDKLYVVLRTELSLYGTSTSCTDGSGKATVNLLNNHVVGCHIPDTSGGAATDCNSAQYEFIDYNTTQYVVTTGTYVTKQLTTGTGDGGAVTCDDVLKAIP